MFTRKITRIKHKPVPACVYICVFALPAWRPGRADLDRIRSSSIRAGHAGLPLRAIYRRGLGEELGAALCPAQELTGWPRSGPAWWVRVCLSGVRRCSRRCPPPCSPRRGARRRPRRPRAAPKPAPAVAAEAPPCSARAGESRSGAVTETTPCTASLLALSREEINPRRSWFSVFN